MKKRKTKKSKSTNKKVRNATPTEYDGIKFRSKLEVYTYKKLRESNIYTEYEQNRYEIIPAFTFMGKKIRAMTYLPDFVGEDYILECKGYPNDAWPLREKIFKYYLFLTNSKKKFHVLHSQKEVDEFIKEYESNRN